MPSEEHPHVVEVHTLGIVGFGEIGQAFCQRAVKAGWTVTVFNEGLRERPPYSQAFRDRVDQAGATLALSLRALLTQVRVVVISVPGDQTEVVLTRMELEHRSLVRDPELGRLLIFDVSSGSPSVKRSFAPKLRSAEYVDGAIMGSPLLGDSLSVYLAGSRSAWPFLEGLGFRCIAISDTPGDAAALKCVWQIITKGLQAMMIEALDCARVFGVNYLDPPPLEIGGRQVVLAPPPELLGHLAQNIDRKARELRLVVEELESLGYQPTISKAATEVLRHASKESWEPAVPMKSKLFPWQRRNDTPKHI